MQPMQPDSLEVAVISKIAYFSSVAFGTEELARDLDAEPSALRALDGQIIGEIYRCELWPAKDGHAERLYFDCVDSRLRADMERHLDDVHRQQVKEKRLRDGLEQSAPLGSPEPNGSKQQDNGSDVKAEPTAAERELAVLQAQVRHEEFLAEAERQIKKLRLDARLADLRADGAACLVPHAVAPETESAGEPNPATVAERAQRLVEEEKKSGVVLTTTEAIARIMPRSWRKNFSVVR